MSLNKKHIEVVPYNPEWPKQFEHEADLIKNALKDNLLAIHHVGSTAVPGLAAKPTIDIIAVIKDPGSTIPLLENAGFSYKGEWNIPFKYGFTKRGEVKVNLHAFEDGHPEIELNLLFRDYLRNHPEVRDAYTKLKYTLLEDEKSYLKNNGMFAGYTLGKSSFINEIINKTGFQGLRFLRCTHPSEWEAYLRIRKLESLDATQTGESHIHFVLCKGTQVVSIAHLELINDTEAVLRFLGGDVETHLRQQLERWVTQNGRKLL